MSAILDFLRNIKTNILMKTNKSTKNCYTVNQYCGSQVQQ